MMKTKYKKIKNIISKRNGMKFLIHFLSIVFMACGIGKFFEKHALCFIEIFFVSII